MMEELVRNLQVSLGQRIDAQTWMSDSTKANAHKKLDKFYVKIGYPDKWTDYSKLTIDPSKSFYENVLNTRRFALKKMIADKAGKPVDRDEWYMTPQTVNAYYNPTTNEICFPAGILQRPFFDPTTRADSMTLMVTCMTGGRHRTQRVSTSAPNCIPTSSTLSKCCPDFILTAALRWARTSPTTEASRLRSML